MKVTISGVTYEGTPQELKQIVAANSPDKKALKRKARQKAHKNLVRGLLTFGMSGGGVGKAYRQAAGIEYL